jgi:hypothetical protein
MSVLARREAANVNFNAFMFSSLTDRSAPFAGAPWWVSNRSVRRGESAAARICANTRYKSSASGAKARRESREFVGAQHRQLQPNEMTKVMRKFVSKARSRALGLRIQVTGPGAQK